MLNQIENISKSAFNICLLLSLSFIFCVKTGKAQTPFDIKRLNAETLSENDSVRFEAIKRLYLYYKDNNVDSSRYYLDKLKTFTLSKNSSQFKSVFFKVMAEALEENDRDSAIYYYRKALKNYKYNNDIPGILNSYTSLGINYYQDQKADSAIFYFQKAISIYEAGDDYNGLSEMYSYLEKVYSNLNADFSKSVELLYKVIDYSEKTENINFIGQAHINIGNSLIKLNRWKEAEEEITKGLAILEPTEDWARLSHGHKILSNIVKDQEKRISHVKTSLEYSLKTQDKLAIFESREKLIHTYEVFGKWSEALTLLKTQSKELEEVKFSDLSHQYYEVRHNLEFALCNYQLGNMSDYSRHLKLAEEANLPIEKLPPSYYMNHLTLSKGLYEITGDFEKAIDYIYLRFNFLDSVRSARNNKLISELKTKYETEKKEQEIVNLKQAAEIQSLTITRKNYQIAVAILLILFLAGMGYSYSKRIKLHKEKLKLAEEKKKLLKEEVDKKSRMLTTTSVQWINMSEQLNQLKIDLKKALDEANTKESSKLIRRIQRIKDFENQWDSFKIHFESVHPDFFDELQGSFSELTAKDLKICAFIKMKHSNSEIAQILNITKRAVEQSKRRLKKKLGLGYEDDLQHFIDNFQFEAA